MLFLIGVSICITNNTRLGLKKEKVQFSGSEFQNYQLAGGKSGTCLPTGFGYMPLSRSVNAVLFDYIDVREVSVPPGTGNYGGRVHNVAIVIHMSCS